MRIPHGPLRTWLLHKVHDHRVMRFPTFAPEIHRDLVPHTDYVRRATLGLALQRIADEHIAGAIAEVGVYRGELSAFLHRVAPSRQLYLFDTFSGFPKKDIAPGEGEDHRFADTALAIVKSALGDLNNITIRPGEIPSTLTGLEGERFALVVLDLDLYAPTLESLRFFYPRVSPGGYVAVHDYNSPESRWACKRALDEFMADKPEKPVDLCDVAGTALFRKLAAPAVFSPS